MIAVVGSANIDLTTRLPRIPRPGETIRGTSLLCSPGGKGANQAVAAAYLAPTEVVAFFGRIGTDPSGDDILDSLRKAGVDMRGVERDPEQPTGTATIWVEDSGENAIAYVPGANASVNRAFIDRVFPAVAAADVLLLQLEIPIESIAYLLDKLDPERPFVILDPAPAQDLSPLPLSRIDVLTPNRGELAAITGIEELRSAMARIRELGVRRVVCKSGAEGAYVLAADSTTLELLAPPKIDPVDTTAAGDAFNAALACKIVSESLTDAVRWANVAGALTTTAGGAQPSIPKRSAVDSFIRSLRSLERDAA
ncbi:ribokinase [Candidatus Bipolaricaulota bacterium]|nr:ribokinase [Candidatus Bipolaricaulota bacterium]